jgi:hypothetical protein
VDDSEIASGACAGEVAQITYTQMTPALFALHYDHWPAGSAPPSSVIASQAYSSYWSETVETILRRTGAALTYLTGRQ